MFLRLAAVALLFSGHVHASEKLSILHMSELEKIEGTLASPKPDTLFVFDIDNTLLRTKQDLGGDAWFTWQESLLKSSPGHADLVAPDLNGLLIVQGWMFALGTMISPEPETPQIFRQLQRSGHPVILLTSRGIDFENHTQRELSRNGYEPQLAAVAPRAGYAQTFVPYNLEQPETACLSVDDVQRLGLPAAKPVVYRRGILLTGGQHKGAMLRALLCKLNKSYSTIVFVDDHQKHVDRVFAAYENQAVDLRSVKYSFMDEEVKAFHDGDKAQVKAQWIKLRDVLKEIF